MKKVAVSIIAIMALVVLLSQPTTSDALLALLFLGIVPGTDIQVPFWIMMLLLLGGGYVLIRWLGSQPLYIGNLHKQEQTARKLARKKVTNRVHPKKKSPVNSKTKRTYKSTKKQATSH